MYITNDWCTNTVSKNRHCCANLEFVTVKRRPIYLPREFTIVLVTAVYIPPDANTSLAIRLLHDGISKLKSKGFVELCSL